MNQQQLCDALLTQLQGLGGSAGNQSLRQKMSQVLGVEISQADYDAAREVLLAANLVNKGRGKGGSVSLVTGNDGETEQDAEAFALSATEAPVEVAPVVTTKAKAGNARVAANQPNQVLSYRYDEKRKNNPHVGMVNTANDDDETHTTWAHDPHIDPELHFDSARAGIENLIDDALASGDPAQMQAALEQLKRMQSPYLSWTGKAERISFEVDTVSLHVHERIDPATILAGIQKCIKDNKGKTIGGFQPDLFHAPFENLPLSKAVDFYKHERDWANRLVAGDSLLVMNSLLQKEGMAGQVQMIYIDPPYGIKYGSNFQPFTGQKKVDDRKDSDLNQEPEMLKAFRDTWELGIHSYLTYLRDRLLLSKELLSQSGSVFVQISDENIHHIRSLMDEIFGSKNFVALIPFRKKLMPLGASSLEQMADFLIWYATDKSKIKYKHLYKESSPDPKGRWTGVVGNDLSLRRFSDVQRKEIKNGAMPNGIFGTVSQWAPSYSPANDAPLDFKGSIFTPTPGQCWVTSPNKMKTLAKANRLFVEGEFPRFVSPHTDFEFAKLTAPWDDTAPAQDKTYVVQTNENVISRCINMTTDPGDLVLDPTCGSGTTAFVSEKLGRRWITCDTSRVAVTLAKQRLITASYDYFELKYPQEGLRGGFIYKLARRISLKTIANNPEIDEIYERLHPAIFDALINLNHALQQHGAMPFAISEGARKGNKVDFNSPPIQTMTLPNGEAVQMNAMLEWEVPFDFPDDWPHEAEEAFDAFHAARQAMQKAMDASIASHADTEILYDQPQVSKKKLRITGPFTVEAVPFATVLALDEAEQPVEADVAVARSGETSRQSLWRDELLKTGIRGKGGQKLKLLDLEPLPGAKYIHAVGVVAETNERVAVSFGPEHAALEQRQVEIAMCEAGELFPLPKLLVFCAFTFDPEAAKDIDNIKGIQALKVQMNTDLLTEDLKKGRASNESFWLMGQPDVVVKKVKGDQFQVEVNGFDYFDTKTGELKSGGKKNIAMWTLDTDYDNRSLYPRQVFFPMAGNKEGWYKLKKDIRAELDESLLDKFHGTTSLPFEAGDNQCIAVKIVDDRGIESLKVIRLDQV